MALLNTHGVMPASAAATGSAVSLATPVQGTAGQVLTALGISLLVLTALFAVIAFKGMLPRAQRVPVHPAQKKNREPS